MTPFRRACLVLLCLASLGVSQAACAQAYPTKPVRLVVPYPAGGAVDVVARIIGQKVGEALGQSFVIDNRGGSTGMIGTDIVGKSAPDGYTLLLTAYPPHNVYPLFYNNVPFDGIRDFTPVAIVVTVPQAMVVSPAFGVNSVKELIDYSKRNPGKLSYASSGVGTTAHVGGELLKSITGIDMVHVVYKGGAQAMNDVLSGQVQVGMIAFSTVLPHVRAGKLRLLGVLQARRVSSAPDFPTIAEGGVPGFDVPELFFAIIGPAGLPGAVVARINAEVNRAGTLPDVRSKLEGAGFEIASSTPKEFADLVARHTVVYRKFVTDAGVKPE